MLTALASSRERRLRTFGLFDSSTTDFPSLVASSFFTSSLSASTLSVSFTTGVASSVFARVVVGASVVTSAAVT